MVFIVLACPCQQYGMPNSKPTMENGLEMLGGLDLVWFITASGFAIETFSTPAGHVILSRLDNIFKILHC